LWTARGRPTAGALRGGRDPITALARAIRCRARVTREPTPEGIRTHPIVA